MERKETDKEEVRKAMNVITDFIKENMFCLDSKTSQKWIDIVRDIEYRWSISDREKAKEITWF